MNAIDFSPAKPENKADFTGWRRVLSGDPTVLVITGGVVLLAIAQLLASGHTQIQQYLIGLLTVAMVAGGYIIVGRNVSKQHAAMKQFAALNSWKYEDTQVIDRASLPPTVAEAFTASEVKRRWRITGAVEGHEFILYEVNGMWHAGRARGWKDRTVLEATGTTDVPPTLDYVKTEIYDGGVRVILGGNALTREDLAAMFAAAGLS